MKETFLAKSEYDMNDLLQIMTILRGEQGCPWDRAQDHHSIRNNFIEETYEAIEAIDREDPVLLREELGDVLLQIVFHAKLEDEEGHFSFGDVCSDICKKLIARHPHVFGPEGSSSAQDALERWDAMKKKEKGYASATDTLQQVSNALPSLMRAQKVAGRAKKQGLQFPLQSLKGFMSKNLEILMDPDDSSPEQQRRTWGDFLFAAAMAAEQEGIPAEEELAHSAERFIQHFSQYEQLVKERCDGEFPHDKETTLTLWQDAERTR